MAQMITDIVILFEYKQKYNIMNYDKENLLNASKRQQQTDSRINGVIKLGTSHIIMDTVNDN